MHGAADGAPGLFVDRLADVLVVHAESQAVLDSWREPLAQELGELAAVGKVHPPQASRGGISQRVLWGAPPDSLLVQEDRAHFHIRPMVGLSVGLFLDMREVREWVRQQAVGRTVLNLFAYTCSFGVAALGGGASRVLNLDLSRAYLDWGQDNYRANGLPVDRRDFVFGDAFDWLARLARRGQRFDVVIVDPPSFSRGRRGAFSVERDYVGLAAAAARVVADGRILL
ncbi:MAG: class I SAM-dependent methyltransferase, partial [Chloroflexota bacterium]|nr:class I SAM-dependent methyltransferase [Chloroflexota bacterium]